MWMEQHLIAKVQAGPHLSSRTWSTEVGESQGQGKFGSKPGKKLIKNAKSVN